MASYNTSSGHKVFIMIQLSLLLKKHMGCNAFKNMSYDGQLANTTPRPKYLGEIQCYLI